MAPQMKNNFVQSKMNKDLDDRLLSAGEYRDALNVNVSRSEGDDVGALENILGNLLKNDLLSEEAANNISIIGYVKSEIENSSIFFLTDYTDESEDNLSNPAPYGANCFIVYLKIGSSPKKLVSGRFLNFSKTHKVLGVDILEDLLYFTDDRNQPRKINWKTAIEDPNYYYNEDHLSVAKYYPYTTPVLKDEIEIVNTYNDKKIEWWDDAWPGSLQGYTDYSTYYYINDLNLWPKLKIGMEVLGFEREGDTVGDEDVSFSRPRFRTFIIEKFVDEIIPGILTKYYIRVNSDPNAENPKVAKGPFDDRDPEDYNGDLKSIKLGFPTSQNQYDRYLKPHARVKFSGQAFFRINVTDWSSEEVLPGMQITGAGLEKPVTISSIIVSRSQTDGKITSMGLLVNRDIGLDEGTTISVGDSLYVGYQNPNFSGNWPGDQELLSDKFVRFAYRFKFDDGEYSLISPFTQPAFIPKQNGYIVTEGTLAIPGKDDDQEEIIYEDTDQTVGIASSTVIQSFENSVNNVNIQIPLEYKCNELKDKLKVSEVDILYHDGGLAIYVIESIPIDDDSFTENDTNIYDFDYQSNKPFKVLPESETIRVFDKVPVRAKSQSISGNRIIYGNILDKHTPPKDIGYNVRISEKYKPGSYTKPASDYPQVDRLTSLPSLSYPQHTVKQNRTYQVGVVLSDRYGRQSDVVLSEFSGAQVSVNIADIDEIFDASTTYHPYASIDTSDVSEWRGDSIKVLFRKNIPLERSDESGYPGLYRPLTYERIIDETGNFSNMVLSGFDDSDKYGGISIGDIVSGLTEDGEIKKSVVSQVKIGQNDPNEDGVYVQGLDNTNYADGEVLTFQSQGNILGWHAYKIVVKQQAQEFYNVYLGQVTDVNKEAQVVTGGYGSGVNYNDFNVTSLISDNVNKVPADLNKVSPLQTQFGTSNSILYPRVGAYKIAGKTRAYPNQFYLGQKGASISAYGKMTDLGMQVARQTEQNEYPTSQGIWSASNNPTCIILGMADGESLGIEPYKTSKNSLFACFEVKPVESKIEIYWETSTTGLISDLNNLIAGGPPSQGVLPVDPDAVPPGIATGYKYTTCDDVLYGDELNAYVQGEPLVQLSPAFKYNNRTYSFASEVPIIYDDEQPLIEQDDVVDSEGCPPADAVFGAKITLCDPVLIELLGGSTFIFLKSDMPSGTSPGKLYQASFLGVETCWFYEEDLEATESDISQYPAPIAPITLIDNSNNCNQSPCAATAGGLSPFSVTWSESKNSGQLVSNQQFVVQDEDGATMDSETLEVNVESMTGFAGGTYLAPTALRVVKSVTVGQPPEFGLVVDNKLAYTSFAAENNPFTVNFRITDTSDPNVDVAVSKPQVYIDNEKPVIKRLGHCLPSPNTPVGPYRPTPGCIGNVTSGDALKNFPGSNFLTRNDENKAGDGGDDFTVNSDSVTNADNCVVWAGDDWNELCRDRGVNGIGPWLAQFSQTTNGSVPSNDISDADGQLRNTDGTVIDPNNRLAGLEYRLKSTPVANTCKFNKDTGKVEAIGWRNGTSPFKDKLKGADSWAIQNPTANKTLMYCTYETAELAGDAIPSKTGSLYGNSGDKRAALVIEARFEIIDASGGPGSQPSEEYRTRTIIYKGSKS